jgi:hypothetical protein
MRSYHPVTSSCYISTTSVKHVFIYLESAILSDFGPTTKYALDSE